ADGVATAVAVVSNDPPTPGFGNRVVHGNVQRHGRLWIEEVPIGAVGRHVRAGEQLRVFPALLVLALEDELNRAGAHVRHVEHDRHADRARALNVRPGLRRRHADVGLAAAHLYSFCFGGGGSFGLFRSRSAASRTRARSSRTACTCSDAAANASVCVSLNSSNNSSVSESAHAASSSSLSFARSSWLRSHQAVVGAFTLAAISAGPHLPEPTPRVLRLDLIPVE